MRRRRRRRAADALAECRRPAEEIDWDDASVSGAAQSTLADIGRRAGAEGMLIGRASGAGRGCDVRRTHRISGS